MKIEKAQQEFYKKAQEQAKKHLVEYSILTDKNFMLNWHIDLICDRLEMIERGELRNLIVVLPPRHSKSFLINEKFPAWYLSKHPERKIITASSGQRLASKFVTRAYQNFVNPISQELFGIAGNPKKKSSKEWQTILGGAHNGFGIQSGIIGDGANILVIDDPYRTAEQAMSRTVRDKVWREYRMAATTRLTPKGAIIIVSTRFHLDDLIGRIIDDEEENKTIDDWEILHLPAIAEVDESFVLSDGRIVGRKKGDALHSARYDIDELESKRKRIGLEDFLTNYQGTPIIAETQTFKSEWFQEVESEDVTKIETAQGQRMLRLLAIDAAFSEKETADYTGFVDMRVDRQGKMFIRSWRKKLSPTDLVDEIIKQQKNNVYDRIFFEGQMYDVAISAFLNDKANEMGVAVPVETISHNRATKELRIRAIEPYLRNGEIYFIKNWWDNLKTEMLTFPKGKTDDVLDALALCISGIKEMRKNASKGNVYAQPIKYSV